PELVRDDVRATLPAVPRSLTAAIREGRHTFEEAGGPRAYFGDPAAATAGEGARTVRTLGEILAEAVEARLAAAGRRNLESPGQRRAHGAWCGRGPRAHEPQRRGHESRGSVRGRHGRRARHRRGGRARAGGRG